MRRTSVRPPQPFAKTRRREAARACSYGARTAAEVARQLATDRGSPTSTLDGLVEDGVLRITSVPHSIGQAYELVEEWRPALVEAIGAETVRGQMRPGEVLLFVGTKHPAAFGRVAKLIATDPVVLWAARADGPIRLILAVRGESADEREQVDRLEATLAAEGLECFQVRIDRVLEIRKLERYARTLTRPPPVAELPPAALDNGS